MRKSLRWIMVVSAAVGICVIVTVSSVGLSNGATPATPTAPDPNNIVTVAVSTQFAETAIPVTVRAGDQFTVTLPSNPSTGYSWQMLKEPDSKVLKKTGSKYNEPQKQNPPIVGAGGKETWSFKAAGKGKQNIEMVYVRPWEKGVAPVRKQPFEVTVL